MPRRGGRHFVLLSRAQPAMLAFREEVAKEIGLWPKIQQVGWEGLTTREVGNIGGEMVKRIIIMGELAILERFNRGERPLLQRMASPEELTSVTGPDQLEEVLSGKESYPEQFVGEDSALPNPTSPTDGRTGTTRR